MATLHRRQFLVQAAAGAGALEALAARGASRQPSDRIRLGIMGLRNRGKDLVRGFSACPGVEIAYLCDADANMVPAALDELRKRQAQAPTIVKDVRRVLDDPGITGLVVAAPDHWHALATIWACQAGKHVYVEKPISHNLIEGRRMVEAARKHNRIVQVGTQRRSGAHYVQAAELVRSGKLGKIPFARTWIAGPRPSIGRLANCQVPLGVDYDLWLGPAPLREFNPNRFHYNWHWYWDYGTGELGNNGIHALDLARWVLGVDAPIRVSCGGGKYYYDDDQETPDTQLATFDFADTCITWEHRIWSRTGVEGENWGVILYGEHGNLVFDRKGWHVKDGIKASALATEFDRAHLLNFLGCIRDGGRPNADIDELHKSTRLCHLGNIAWRLGRTLHFDAASERIRGDDEANRLLGRTYRKPFVVPVTV